MAGGLFNWAGYTELESPIHKKIQTSPIRGYPGYLTLAHKRKERHLKCGVLCKVLNLREIIVSNEVAVELETTKQEL